MEELFIGTNEEIRTEAIRGFMGLIGGPAGLIQHNIPLSKLNLIRDADLNDPGVRGNLEFLATIATRARGTVVLSSPRRKTSEPYLTPDVAKKWLVDTGRARVFGENLELLEDDKNVHISLAALAIANSTEPQIFSEAYAELSDGLSSSMIADMSRRIVATYVKYHRDSSFGDIVTINPESSYL